MADRTAIPRIYKAAYIDETECYRYALARWWDYVPPRPGHFPGSGSVLGIMLNPSIADGLVDDPTIRRWISFVQGWGGYTSFTIANLFAFRATDPDKLSSIFPPGAVGPGNSAWLEHLIATHDRIVCAWGAGSSKWPLNTKSCFKVQAAEVETRVRKAGKMPMCWGWTAGGHPKHPLYLPNSAKLIALPVRGQEGRP